MGAPNPFARLTSEGRPNWQKWHTVSRQFLPILQFKLKGLFECLRLIHKYALSLLFHLKSWFPEKLNYATAVARVYKQYGPQNVNLTFAVIKNISHKMFSARKPLNA